MRAVVWKLHCFYHGICNSIDDKPTLRYLEDNSIGGIHQYYYTILKTFLWRVRLPGTTSVSVFVSHV